MFCSLVKLAREAPAAKNIGVTHLDYSILYMFPEKNIVIVIHAAQVISINDQKPVPFYVNFFYRHASALLEEL